MNLQPNTLYSDTVRNFGKYPKRAELHCHSRSNRLNYAPFLYDSVQSVEEIITKVVELEISILAITDHDSLGGYRQAAEYIDRHQLDILLVPGMEVSTKDGHILAYGIGKEIPWKKPVSETIKAIHDQGGIAVAAHPFRMFGLGRMIFDLDLDGVESANAAYPKWLSDRAAKKIAGSGYPCICGSDAHSTIALGNGVTYFRNEVKQVSDVLTAIKQGDCETQCVFTPIGKMISEHMRRSLLRPQQI